MPRARTLLHDRRGVSAVEFALVAPVLVLMIVGVVQMSRIFFADADLRNALAAGARQATIFPLPSDDTILDTVEGSLTGINPDSGEIVVVAPRERELVTVGRIRPYDR